MYRMNGKVQSLVSWHDDHILDIMGESYLKRRKH